MAFKDGFGERRRGQDAGGAELDLLCLAKDLATVPSFEFALRERVSRLSTFRHPSYAHVRAVERSSAAEQTLVIVSDHTPGLRLSDLLAGCEERRLPVDIGAALCVVRQLVPAVAILHESARDASHGAIAPERLVITPNSRLVVAEYVLGSALEQLLYPRERYWAQLRVAVPRLAGLPRFDHLADVTQIGVVALSLVLGRQLRDEEYPAKLAEIVASAEAVSFTGERESLPQALRLWLERTLQLDPRNSFPSAIEARAALDRVMEDCGYDASPARLEALLASYHDPVPVGRHDSSTLRVQAPTVAPAPIVSPPVPVARITPIAPPVPVAALPIAPAPTVPSLPVREWPLVSALDAVEPPLPRTDDGATSFERLHETPRRPGNRLMAAAVVGAILIGSGATMAARRFLAEKPAVVTTGTLTVTTEPTGAQARVDGVAQGVTPLTVALTAGPHMLQLRGEHGTREISVTITAGAQVVQYVDLPKETLARVSVPEALLAPPMPAPAAPPAADTSSLAGWIGVTGRFDVKVFEAGRLLGSSESDRIMVLAGRHDLEFVNDELGYHGVRTVQVAAGKVAAVALDTPEGAVALNAVPWAEVFIDGNSAGETPLGNVSLPIGGHDVMFRHPELGERRYRIAVTLKAPARLSVDMRRP